MMLKNRWVFVAGSAEPDGIGFATAEMFAEEMGANVILHGRRSSRKKLEVACDEIKAAHGVDAIYFTTDFSLMLEIDVLFDEIERHAGELWAMVNSVGMAHGWNKDEYEVTQEEWDKTMQINVHAARRCIEKSSALMPNGGRIVNIGSIGADVPWPKAFPYRKAKQALHDLTLEMADALAERGILLNCVKPGLVVTRQTQERSLLDRAYHGQFSRAIEWLKENYRQDVMLHPEEIAKVIIQLCSPDCRVHGENRSIDRGLTEYWSRNAQIMEDVLLGKK